MFDQEIVIYKPSTRQECCPNPILPDTNVVMVAMPCGQCYYCGRCNQTRHLSDCKCVPEHLIDKAMEGKDKI